jgi:hypothetical protein
MSVLRRRRLGPFARWVWIMIAALLIYTSAITLVGAFLFTAVERLEPNHRLAIVFKCAILAAGGRRIWADQIPDIAVRTRAAARSGRFWPPGAVKWPS